MRRQSYCRGGDVDVGKLKNECVELDQGGVGKNDERLSGFGKRVCWM
jgi:hypothetical protein